MRWKVDELFLQQVITNAVKYMDFKGDFPDPYLYKGRCRQKELVVEDNGVGISPGDIGRVFEKGFTGANGRAADKTVLWHPREWGFICAESFVKNGYWDQNRIRRGRVYKSALLFWKSTYLTKL